MLKVLGGAGLMALLLGTVPAWAEDTLTRTIYNYATLDSDGTFVSNHEGEIVLEGTVGDWTFGADLWGGISNDWDSDELTLDVPTLELYVSSDAFGKLSAFDTDPALSAACVQPTAGSTDFGTEDLMTFGTCAGYTDGQAITYTTPELFDGVSLAFSAMGDVKGIIDDGAVDQALSAAVILDKTVDDISYTGSFGVDVATSVKGDDSDEDLPVTVQAGLNIGWDDWVVGAAAQYEFNSLSGGNSWGAGVGLSKQVTEQLALGAELAYDRYEEDEVAMQELSLGATAEYAIVKDQVGIEGAINVLHRTGGDVDETVGQIGTGIWFSF